MRVTYRLYGLQGAPPEKTPASEEYLLALVEQLVAPFDGSPEGPLPLGQVSRSAGEQLEAVAQAGQQRLRGSSFMRAAASSMARGSPSSLAQISATAEAFSSVSEKSGLTALAAPRKA